MSNDMVVISPVVPGGNPDPSMMPSGGASGGSIVGGPPPQAQLAIDFQSGNYYNRALTALSKILKSTKFEVEKQKNAIIFLRDCIFLNKCMVEQPNNGTYIAQGWNSKQRLDMRLDQGIPTLGNNPYAIISALNNYLTGNGRGMSIDISTLALQFLKPNDIPGFNERMNSTGRPGQHNMTFSFPYNTAGTNVFMPYILGNITLQLDGVFTRNASGSWGFNGVIRAQVPDLYNFNASTHRSKTNEDLTTFGRWLGERFNGVPFEIQINGQTPVNF
ncbi:lipid II-degrading bacteriocin [Erwinia mallotivora]|uniref:Lipid II-degrading bacteriocin n=1 Tax=Erwinia mallotivora TaxID=69222 RepID=A0A014NSQ6_9GAMM|nr:lipid II-degrading bacteriocin [Erwinia mallotivora]EXU76895.1 hypothetical protein BG55_03105 [Erwinia mallotivora]